MAHGWIISLMAVFGCHVAMVLCLILQVVTGSYSSYGWTWASDYNWGWAPFHYGRWAYDPFYGWMWVPGYEWGPAWVSMENRWWLLRMVSIRAGMGYWS